MEPDTDATAPWATGGESLPGGLCPGSAAVRSCKTGSSSQRAPQCGADALPLVDAPLSTTSKNEGPYYNGCPVSQRERMELRRAVSPLVVCIGPVNAFHRRSIYRRLQKSLRLRTPRMIGCAFTFPSASSSTRKRLFGIVMSIAVFNVMPLSVQRSTLHRDTTHRFQAHQGFASSFAVGSLVVFAKRLSHGNGFGLACSSTSAGFQPPRPCSWALFGSTFATAPAPGANR